MFAGIQYMEALERQDTKARVKVMANEWEKLHEQNPLHNIHLELAYFYYPYTVKYTVKYLFPHADSIGLNEQEADAVIKHIESYKGIEHVEDESGDDDGIGTSDSKLEIHQSFNQLVNLISNHVDPDYPNIHRVQYHTLGTMIV